MAISADVFSGLLAFVFGNAALAKLLRQELQVQTAAKLQIPWTQVGYLLADATLLGLATRNADVPVEVVSYP